MVKLNKIYTRTGDGGTAGLVDGSRVSKCSARMTAIGEVDEANSLIGMAIPLLGEHTAARLRLAVNGRAMQDGTTASMIFGVGALVSYISRFARLEPGDLVCTGTPAGVGQARVPPEYLRAGDRVEASIDGLGRQSFRVVDQAGSR